MALEFKPVSEIINETRDFEVTLNKTYTVKEFIDMILSTADNNNNNIYNHGKISINKRLTNFTPSNLSYEYQNDKLKSEPPSEKYMNEKIKQVTANGGWGSMDFVLYLE